MLRGHCLLPSSVLAHFSLFPISDSEAPCSPRSLAPIWEKREASEDGWGKRTESPKHHSRLRSPIPPRTCFAKTLKMHFRRLETRAQKRYGPRSQDNRDVLKGLATARQANAEEYSKSRKNKILCLHRIASPWPRGCVPLLSWGASKREIVNILLLPASSDNSATQPLRQRDAIRCTSDLIYDFYSATSMKILIGSVPVD